MTRPLVTIAALAAMIIAAAGTPDRTTRRGLRPQTRLSAPTTAMTAEAADTVTPSHGMIDVSGYDKPLRSASETLFITNHSRRRLTGVQLRITYLDAHGRQLHEATMWLDTDIPPG